LENSLPASQTRSRVAAGFGAVLAAGIAQAQPPVDPEQWTHCVASPVVSTPLLRTEAPSPGGPMVFSAAEAQAQDGRYQLQGKVTGGRGEQRISADSLIYNADTDRAQVTGNVRYQRGARLFTGDSAELNLSNDTGSIESAHFWLSDRHLRGEAQALHLLGPTETRLERVSFTTCDEGAEAWRLTASELRLDTAANEGIARHARLEFMSVPIFYFPYLSFPLQGRKSGLLTPSVSEGTVTGTELRLPYYWNIAPAQDATFTPRFMSRRGVLLESEYRYLGENSEGQLTLAHLPGDRVFGRDRSSLNYRHRGRPAAGWRTEVDYRYASDSDYLKNFGGQLSSTSATHLERRADIAYRGETWQANLLLQAYQTLDPSLPAATRPYQRLPQLRFSRDDDGPAGSTWDLRAEAVRFDRAEGVVGNRYDMQVGFGWPQRWAAGFLRPRLALRHTLYQLQQSEAGRDARPVRSLPLFSLDSGLLFERALNDRKGANDTALATQTLEPRLFYLYVPRRQQSNLIVDETGTQRVFDSSLPLFGVGQLFRENRFSGVDRVADANQISAALTTRFLDGRGRERFSASAGRILYFQNREVTLPGQAVETSRTSDWVAELKANWNSQFSARASVQWDSARRDLNRGVAQLRYLKNKRRVLRLAYRFDRERPGFVGIKQADLAFMWPLTPRWQVVGRWLRDVQGHTTLETLSGLEYQSCCWALRLVQRRYRVNAVDEEFSSSIWFQLELKGLTSVGRQVEKLLARDILADF